MFEKDAEKYADEKCGTIETEEKKFCRIDYQRGAEFGYNKAKIEVEEKYKETICNLEMNLASVTERLEELEKANEWHYPSKGEFPECDENTLLTIYVTCYYEVGGSLVTRNRTVLGYYQKSFMNDDVKVFVEKSKGYSDEHLPKDVIAWKEIVPPSLDKEKADDTD